MSRTNDAPAPTDFTVVGAGPVGLTCAILLARDGWGITVLEKWPSRYPMPRACTIDHEALRILQSAGVMQSHSDLFEPSRGERGGYQVRNGDGVLLRAINWNRAAESGWANTNGFYQPDLEAVLETMAVDAGVRVERGWTAAGLTQDADGVDLRVRRTDDPSITRTMRGRWLIGADGANSVIRDALGIESLDSGFEADWLVVDYEPIVDRTWDAFVTQYCDPRQPATAVNSGPGRRRFEFMRRAEITAAELARPETAWRLMKPWGVTPENATIERHAVYTFRGRWVDRWRVGRVFLAGDAAHLMPPFLGQGLCAGLRDARSLTWRLSLVASGGASDRILDSYGSERSTHVREIIDEAVALGRIICELDPVLAAQRDERMLAELHDPAAVTVEPPQPRLGEPSITEPGDAVAGTLSVQGRVERGGLTGLFDDVVGGSWQLISRAGPLELPDDLRVWFEGIGGTVTSLARDARDVDGTYGAWFEAHACTVVLSRPDFSVYGTGQDGDAARLIGGLRRALGASTPPAETADTAAHTPHPIDRTEGA